MTSIALFTNQFCAVKDKTVGDDGTEKAIKGSKHALPIGFTQLFLPVGLAISQVGNKAIDAFLLVAETRDLGIALGISISAAAFFTAR